jgi:hypothetical protein
MESKPNSAQSIEELSALLKVPKSIPPIKIDVEG